MISKVDNNEDNIIGNIEIELVTKHTMNLYLGKMTPGEQVDRLINQHADDDSRLRTITLNIDERE